MRFFCISVITKETAPFHSRQIPSKINGKKRLTPLICFTYIKGVNEGHPLRKNQGHSASPRYSTYTPGPQGI